MEKKIMGVQVGRGGQEGGQEGVLHGWVGPADEPYGGSVLRTGGRRQNTEPSSGRSSAGGGGARRGIVGGYFFQQLELQYQSVPV